MCVCVVYSAIILTGNKINKKFNFFHNKKTKIHVTSINNSRRIIRCVCVLLFFLSILLYLNLNFENILMNKFLKVQVQDTQNA